MEQIERILVEIHRLKNELEGYSDQETLDYIESYINIISREQPLLEDTVAFQKGVQEGRRLEREDVKSIIQSRIDEILGDAQPNPILRMELQELIKKIEA